jgi:hypothetical protein
MDSEFEKSEESIIQNQLFVVSYSRENLLEAGNGENSKLLMDVSATGSLSFHKTDGFVDTERLSDLHKPKPDISVSSTLVSTGIFGFSYSPRNKIRIATFLLLISLIFLRFYNFNINSSFSRRSIGRLPTVPSSRYQPVTKQPSLNVHKVIST